MKIKIFIFIILLCFFALLFQKIVDYHHIRLNRSIFINTIPAQVTLNNVKYILTDSKVSRIDIEMKITDFESINTIVSYVDDENPYLKVGGVYKIKKINIKEFIAVEINDIYYFARKY